MKAFNFARGAVMVAILFGSKVASADLDPIVIKVCSMPCIPLVKNEEGSSKLTSYLKGSKFFFSSNGTQFFMKGIAYQQDFSTNGTISGGTKYTDPLVNADTCGRDIPLLRELQTNTIRVYAIDPKQDHSKCMQLLQDAGIYLIADLGEPTSSINRNTPEWTLDLYARYTSVVDALQKYPNVLGFFAGNEVSNSPNNTQASAFVKAAVRDIKAYIKQKKYRPIGVGYATNDDETRTNLANYFDCGTPEESLDFWGYNIYSWCGDSDITKSSYQERTDEFSTYNVPAFFAEYGCNVNQPRIFTEVGALFGSKMTPVWSGGILYMYFQETNDFGLVTIDSNSKASKLPDFTAYSKQIALVKPTGVNSASYTPTNKPRSCPTIGPSWEASNILPPSPNQSLCSCMVQNLTCTAKSDLTDDSIKVQFAFVCDPKNGNNCGAIDKNATSGVYGAYSMCNPLDRLSKAFDTYYKNQVAKNPANTSPCDFKGAAQKQSPKVSSQCQAVISQAGPAGTGVISSSPTGTGSGSSTATSKGAASSVIIPDFSVAILRLAACVATAAFIGSGVAFL